MQRLEAGKSLTLTTHAVFHFTQFIVVGCGQHYSTPNLQQYCMNYSEGRSAEGVQALPRQAPEQGGLTRLH